MENTKTAFGTMSALKSETPKWAKWTFRIVFILTAVSTFIIASDDAIPMEWKVRLGVYLKGLDMLSKMFGVQVKDEEPASA